MDRKSNFKFLRQNRGKKKTDFNSEIEELKRRLEKLEKEVERWLYLRREVTRSETSRLRYYVDRSVDYIYIGIYAGRIFNIVFLNRLVCIRAWLAHLFTRKVQGGFLVSLLSEKCALEQTLL